MPVHSVKYKRRMIGCVALIVLVVFGTAFGISVAKYVAQRRAPAEPEPVPPPPPVYIVAPTNLTLLRALHAELRADKVITLSAAVDGEILRLTVDVGSAVTQGQTLIELDPRYKLIALREAEAAHDQALITYSNALIDWRNNAQLLTNAVIGDETYRRVRLAYQIAEVTRRTTAATLARAREQLRDCVVTAPCTGFVSARMVERNERVNPMQPLLTLVDDARLRLVFFVEDRDIVCVHTNTPVTFRVDALPDTAFPAVVTAIGADVEPATRLYRVEATYDNSRRLLKPGMVARVQLPIRRLADVICVPAYAVKFDDNGTYVNCLANTGSVRVPVQTGDEYEGWVQILYGLAPGDHVILR